jgi:hypothetical protein
MLQSAVGKKNLVAPSCRAFFRVPAMNATCECDAPHAVGTLIGTVQGFSGTRLPGAPARSTTSASQRMLGRRLKRSADFLTDRT